jgi:hypothetical protein
MVESEPPPSVAPPPAPFPGPPDFQPLVFPPRKPRRYTQHHQADVPTKLVRFTGPHGHELRLALEQRAVLKGLGINEALLHFLELGLRRDPPA